jgi:glutamate-ammonia-ligase adenylyltransferase
MASPDSIIADGLTRVPASLRDGVEREWKQYVSAGVLPMPMPMREPGSAGCLSVIPRVWACSEFVARTTNRHPDVFAEIVNAGDLERAYEHGELRARARDLLVDCADQIELKHRLRLFRRSEMLRIAFRDLGGWAELDEVMATLSELAETCLDVALSWLHDQAVARFGDPIGADSGEPQHLVVIGMGKLGGGELNFSSDIDLVFAYPEDGQTRPGTGEPLSNHEFFTRLGRMLIDAIGDATEDGFVFRVDMRLRPNGNSGPLVLSFDATEHYFQTHGREWERYAWIKARAVAGDVAAGEHLLAALRPFVYRRYLDYGAIGAIREMKAMIEQELQRKGIENNVKLGPGGIREIEFIGQVFQLIRGGRDRALQLRSILPVLELLAQRGWITGQAYEELTAAYDFLRRTENRLQMYADQQVHSLPEEDGARLRLALSMGFEAWTEFDAVLRHHMHNVHEQFEQVFAAPPRAEKDEEEQGMSALWRGLLDADHARERLAEAGYDEPDRVLELLEGLRTGGAYTGFSTAGRERMDRVVPLLLAAAALAPAPVETLARLIRVLEAIGRRSAYLSLLAENPLALSQLVQLCSASPWIANWIGSHPLLLDELLRPDVGSGRSAREDMSRELLQHLSRVDDDDLEQQMEALREFRNARVLRVAAAHIAGSLKAEDVGVALCAIAEVLLEQCLALASTQMIARHGWPACGYAPHGPLPEFAVIGYGKLGGGELGYTSDLDLIFLYGECDVNGMTDGPRPLANESFFARLGQRLIHLLTARTPGGILFDVDMRLRPSGRAGPLVTAIRAFERYQTEQAWVWEHQALVRARCIAGPEALCKQFAAVRRAVLCRERDDYVLRTEVAEMRQRMRESRKPHDPDLFDLKHDAGGIVDIEFMVQYWILRWAHDHPGLIANTGNVQLLQALVEARLLEVERARTLTDAYRHYLATEYRLKLLDRGSLLDPGELEGYPEAVRSIWEEMFARDPAR